MKKKLTEGQIIDLLQEYFSINEPDEISISIKKVIGPDDSVVIKFYLNKYIRYGKSTVFSRKDITKEDLKEAFKYYANKNDWDLIKVKYKGEVRHIGISSEADVPEFDGVVLKVKERSMQRKRKFGVYK